MSATAFLAKISSSTGKFLGTGVLVSERHLLTCRHVAGTAKRLQIEIGGLTATGTVQAISEKRDDLALLSLDTRFPAPPRWSHEDPYQQPVSLYGFENARFRDIPTHVLAAPRDERQQVVCIETPCGALEGMSGGIAARLIAGETRLVALITLGGTGATKSILTGGGVIAPFLAAHGVPLPGWPQFAPPEPQPGDPARYLDWLREDTGWIDIRGFHMGDGQPKRFPIGELYIPLFTRSEEPVDALLNSHRCLIVQGDAGCGKSTLIRHLAHHWSGNRERFPLYIRIAELDRFIRNNGHEPKIPASLEDPRWLAWHLADQDWGLDRAFFLNRLQRQDTVVLLDGLDEALNEERRKSLATLFTKAAEQYPHCRFVVTTRPGAYIGESRPHGFAIDSIAPLEGKAILKFVQDWSRLLYPSAADAAESHRKDLASQVSATEEIKEMASSPMMLTALAAIHWNKRRLPDDRGELYDSILTWLASQREQRAGRTTGKKCLETLRALALEMQTHIQGRFRQLDHDSAAEILHEKAGLSLREARDFLAQEELDSGILVQRGKEVEFQHLTFQEYLAARELLENYSDVEQREILLRSDFRYSVDWREFLKLFAISCAPRKAAALYALLLDGVSDDFISRVRSVALLNTLAGERRDSITDPRYEPLVREMVGIFEGKADRQGLDARTRAEAAEAWERLGDLSRLRLPSDEDYWVSLGNFDIGRCPVTVHEYGVFLRDNPEMRRPRDWERQQQYPHRPVVHVSFPDAQRYCAHWSNVRLPKDDEWYLAACGAKETREYPWGKEEANDDCANFGMRVGRPTPVGLFPAGATPRTGLLDLAGNVWEWVDEELHGGKVRRGGSFRNDGSALREGVKRIV